MYDLRNNAIHGGGFERRKVKTHNVPGLPARHHLEADGVWDVLLVGLHYEAQQIFVK